MDNLISYNPKFFGNRKAVYLSFKAFLLAIFFYPHVVKEFLISFRKYDLIRFREKLFINKVVRFNKKFYFSPTVPAFPSKAYFNMVNNGGLNFLDAGTSAKRQMESLFLAVTNKCSLSCRHCYEKFNINKTLDIPASKWIEIISSMQKKGVSNIILTGGEPLLAFEKLIEILKNSDKDLSDFHIHTSGNSITKEKVLLLKEAGLRAAAIGLDDFDEDRNDRIRGKGAFKDAVNALKLFNEAGIMTYVNFCVSREMLGSGNLYSYMAFVKQLNVSMIQLLEPRPCGGFLNNPDIHLTADEKKKLFEFTLKANSHKDYKDYPLVYYVAHIESKDRLGCHMGGLSLFYIDSAGNVCPCVFFPVSYGNIIEENIEIIYDRMRKNIPRPILAECPSLLLGGKCRELFLKNNQHPICYTGIQEEIYRLYDSSPVPRSFLFSKNEVDERALQ